jgi:hypothetical protein
LNAEIEYCKNIKYGIRNKNNSRGYDDDTIDNAFEGDSDNVWNVD